MRRRSVTKLAIAAKNGRKSFHIIRADGRRQKRLMHFSRWQKRFLKINSDLTGVSFMRCLFFRLPSRLNEICKKIFYDNFGSGNVELIRVRKTMLNSKIAGCLKMTKPSLKQGKAQQARFCAKTFPKETFDHRFRYYYFRMQIFETFSSATETRLYCVYRIFPASFFCSMKFIALPTDFTLFSSPLIDELNFADRKTSIATRTVSTATMPYLEIRDDSEICSDK